MCVICFVSCLIMVISEMKILDGDLSDGVRGEDEN